MSDANAAPARTMRVDVASENRHQMMNVLRAEHVALDELVRTVMARVVDGDRVKVGEAIADLQTRVVRHLEHEERELFAEYAAHAPEDARQLVAQHARIRHALADLDVTVDLHLLRAGALDVFLKALQEHAARENDGLYRWCEQPERT